MQGLDYMPMREEHQVTLQKMLPDDIHSSDMGSVPNESFQQPPLPGDDDQHHQLNEQKFRQQPLKMIGG